MSEFAYSSGNQTRTVIAAPNAWVPVIIPLEPVASCWASKIPPPPSG